MNTAVQVDTVLVLGSGFKIYNLNLESWTRSVNPMTKERPQNHGLLRYVTRTHISLAIRSLFTFFVTY
jgi:hypothetical protein